MPHFKHLSFDRLHDDVASRSRRGNAEIGAVCGRRIADICGMNGDSLVFNRDKASLDSLWLRLRLEESDNRVHGFVAYVSEANGRTTVNVLPLPTSLSAVIEPFCSSRIFLVSARPSPAPG